MRTISREHGFTLVELLVSCTVMLVILGAVMTTFNQAVMISDLGTEMSDSDLNLRAGTNLLVRDLLQAGRVIGVAGIPIPSGTGATPINRPSPPGLAYTFDNTNASTLSAIVTGANLGPVVLNSTTDMITMLKADPVMPFVNLAAGAVAANGASMTLGAGSVWLTGDLANGIMPINVGDLVWFNSGGGAIQTVTSKDSTTVYFAAADWFNFNQRTAAQGTVMQLKVNNAFPAMKVYRVLMTTYYVDATTTPGTPRFTRVQNHYSPQALAGVVEDFELSYDLVDTVTNPINQRSLPYTFNGLTYTANQIRKVNLRVAVRAEKRSTRLNNYMRDQVSTSVTIRDLASVNRYQ